jgi:hypothetical protein
VPLDFDGLLQQFQTHLGTVPLGGVRVPAMNLIVVLLPTPLGPRRPTISPVARLNEISCKTSAPPKENTTRSSAGIG